MLLGFLLILVVAIGIHDEMRAQDRGQPRADRINFPFDSP